VAAWGLRPVELLAGEGVLDERLTAVHATHLTPAEVALLGAAGATVCACPSTERDLGDGFLHSFELLAAGAQIALGTDSQTVIEPLEEMRLVEYHERLRRLQRVILTVPGGADRLENAPPLLEMGTSAGARALRLEAGRIETGHLADLVAVDLEHPTLAGCTAEYLAATLALSAPAAVISDVWVGGVRLVEGGRHPLDDEAPARLRRVAAGL
jgi:formimidoylglutamate deiminase